MHRIRNKRQKKNISQQEPGEYLGVRGAAVSRYENGQLDMPAAALPLISSYCGFSMSDDVRDDKIKMVVKNFELLLQKSDNLKDEPSVGVCLPKDIYSEEYGEMVERLKSRHNEEGAEELLELLYSADKIMNGIEDEEFNRTFSTLVLLRTEQKLNFIQRTGRVNRMV